MKNYTQLSSTKRNKKGYSIKLSSGKFKDMKLVKQSRLHYQDSKSDKVYEVDLCEVGTNLYTINFRYGKRGGSLLSGTKTPSPVSRTEADKVFNKLVASKTKKGYQEQVQATSTSSTPTVTLNPSDFSTAKETIVHYLAEITASKTTIAKVEANKDQNKAKSIWGYVKNILKIGGTSSSSNQQKEHKWPLSRIVWRAGELRIKEAVPHLLKLPVSKELVDQYSLIWALGRCGDTAALPQIEKIIGLKKTHKPAKFLAREAKRLLLTQDQRKDYAKELIPHLAPNFQEAVKTGDSAKVLEAIKSTIEEKKTAYNDIAALYLIADLHPFVRKSLLDWLKEAPLKGQGYFKSIRQLFKASELREDAELYGIISRRIFKSKQGAYRGYYVYIPYDDPRYSYQRWKSIKFAEEIKSETCYVGFMHSTKPYLQKRIWRFLRRKGDVNDASYVKMAVGVLLAYTDEDVQNLPPYEYYSYNYENNRWRSKRTVLHYAPYSSHWAFNEILFKNSDRYQWTDGKTAWIVKPGLNPKELPAASKREEAYPELWDQMPQGMLHLLAESKCKEVHEFAVRATRQNMEKVLPMINTQFICILLEKEYEATTRFALELAREKYDPQNPDPELVLALLRSTLDEARKLGIECLNGQKQLLLADNDFVITCLFNPYEDVQEALNAALDSYNFSSSQSETVVVNAIARILNVTEEATDREKAAILKAGDYLCKHFSSELAQTDFSIVSQLLNHPLPEAKVFGAKILLLDERDSSEIPEDLILKLINGESPEMREVGVKLLSKLPKEDLLDKRELLKGLCLSPYAEIRQSVQPIIGDLAKENKAFGETFTSEIALCLLRAEDVEGRDQDIKNLLNNQLAKFLPTIQIRRILQLIHSPRKAANEMGYTLLNANVKPDDLKMRQIVRLANHEMHPIRKWCWDVYTNNPARIKYEIKEAVRLVDAKWDDSRDFAFDYFRQNFEEKDWSPEILVSICDSVNPPVQQFGKELITKFFDEKDGEQYLLQLSQHPTADLQQFATNYLDRFASDNPENIEKLELYFTTVLSGINKSSVAKQRIFEFLKKEALKDEKTANIVAGILTRQSAMMVIRDKARCIAIMRDLQNVYPNLEMPIKVKEVAVHPV